MSDRLRSGIIGAGMIAEVHARAVRAAGGEVAAVVDVDLPSAERAAARFHAERALTSVEDLLSLPDLDVVHVCTPNHLHAEFARMAIAAGKHVICEKPLAMDVASAAEITRAADAAGVVNAVPFVYRFYPTIRQARARVRDGETGPVRVLHGSYLQDWLAMATDHNWRVDPRIGGASRAFGDIGVHWCDLAEFASGQRITRLSARFVTVHPRVSADGQAEPPTEDAAAILFETDGGALGSLVISQVSHGRKNRLWISVDGEKESLSFDQERPDSLWIGGRAANTVVMRGSGAEDESVSRYNILPPGHPQGYQDSFSGFVGDVYAAVRGEAVDGLPTFADGLRAATLTEAVLSSASSGTWVEVAS